MYINSVYIKRSGKVVLKLVLFFLTVTLLTLILMGAESTIDKNIGIAMLTVVLYISGMIFIVRHLSRDRKNTYYIEDAISDICHFWFLSMIMVAMLSYVINKHGGGSDKVFDDKEYNGYVCDNPDMDLLRAEDSTFRQFEVEDIADYIEYKGRKLKATDMQNINRKELTLRPDFFYYIDEYAFWFFDLVPLLEIPKTLELCPAIKTGDFGKILILAFKIYVIFVFFGITRKLWKAACERKAEDAECES